MCFPAEGNTGLSCSVRCGSLSVWPASCLVLLEYPHSVWAKPCSLGSTCWALTPLEGRLQTSRQEKRSLCCCCLQANRRCSTACWAHWCCQAAMCPRQRASRASFTPPWGPATCRSWSTPLPQARSAASPANTASVSASPLRPCVQRQHRADPLVLDILHVVIVHNGYGSSATPLCVHCCPSCLTRMPACRSPVDYHDVHISRTHAGRMSLFLV